MDDNKQEIINIVINIKQRRTFSNSIKPLILVFGIDNFRTNIIKYLVKDDELYLAIKNYYNSSFQHELFNLSLNEKLLVDNIILDYRNELILDFEMLNI